MDIEDYDIDPDHIGTGLRDIIENSSIDDPWREVAPTYTPRTSVIRATTRRMRKRYRVKHKTPLPAWMTDSSLLPKAPPGRGCRETE